MADEYKLIRMETAPRPGQQNRRDSWVNVCYRRLAGAVIHQAVNDLKSSDPYTAADARRFLLTDGASWAESLGMDPDKVRAYVIDSDTAEISDTKTGEKQYEHE